VADKKGCALQDQSYLLTQPEVVESRLVSIQPPACKGDCNGSIQVEGYGGAGNFGYKWSNGSVDPLLNKLCAGDYTVTITDGKGCQLKDHLYRLNEPEMLTAQLSTKVLPTCYNACNGILVAEALGGNGNYQFEWSSGATAGMAGSLCPGDYKVTINDEKSCEATSTFTVENVPPLTIDLGGSLLVCVGQTHVLEPEGTWTKFEWSSNTGLTSNQSKITISQAGQYWVEVEDSDGCTAQDTFLLETSTDLLNASVLMAPEAHIGDTVVIIDISWPLPDNISWNYPQQMSVLADYGDVIYGQFFESGTYEVTLGAELGKCQDKITKRITIIDNTSEPIGGRLGFENYVKRFELYANPNDGSFDVAVELAEESSITLSVWNVVTSRNVGIVSDRGTNEHLVHFDLRPLSSGTYVLRLDHEKGHDAIRFVVH
jgi:hypothetical protein